MRYDAGADIVAGEYYAEVQAATATNLDLAERHARAMKAVLLAARAWTKACGEPQRGTVGGLSVEYTRRMRLLAAQERLVKIEKEVSRG